MEEAMLTSKEVAERLGITLNTLQKWRNRGVGPKYYKYGGANSAMVRYKESDVAAFMDARSIKPVE